MAEFEPTAQQQVILDVAGDAFVIAGPGTGKTRTAIEKARLSIGTLGPPTHRVLFLSFSNASVFRLAEGAKAELTREQRRRISFRTYHAFAAEILRAYGRFVGIPPVFKIMDKLEEKLFLIEGDVAFFGNDYTEFLMTKAKDGLLGFDILIPLATQFLKSSPRIQSILGRCYPLIVVDEFQDTSQPQWDLLQAIGGASSVIAFGDPNQIIYAGIHAATERRLKEFVEWKGVRAMSFSERQFRFGSPEVLVFADALLGGTPYCVKENSGVQFLDVEYRNKLRVKLALLWNHVRKNTPSGETIAFLAFSNPLAEQIAVTLRNPPVSAKVGFPVYARLARDEAAHDAVLLALAALRDFAVSRDETVCKKAAVAIMAMNMSWYSGAKTSAKRLASLATMLKDSLDADSHLGVLLSRLASSPSLASRVPDLVEAFSETAGFKKAFKRIAAHGKLRLGQVHADEALPLFDQLRASRAPKGLAHIIRENR